MASVFRGQLLNRLMENLTCPLRMALKKVEKHRTSRSRLSRKIHSGYERATIGPSDKPSIAVLPFQNMSGNPEQEYFVDGIVEDIITGLSRIKWLFVIARNSTFTYKGRAVDVKQVGRELGVRYVLEGSVRKVADRVRITAQLIDTSTGAHVWAERYDRNSADIFALQDEYNIIRYWRHRAAANVSPRSSEQNANDRIVPSVASKN